jgi:hypothetical protein
VYARGAIEARWELGLSGDADVDVLGLEIAQECRHPTVASIYNVVGSELDGGRRWLGLGLSL